MTRPADNMGLEVVAEGVETEAQRDYLEAAIRAAGIGKDLNTIQAACDSSPKFANRLFVSSPSAGECAGNRERT